MKKNFQEAGFDMCIPINNFYFFFNNLLHFQYKYGGAMEKTDQDESYVQSPPTSEAAASSGFDLTSHKVHVVPQMNLQPFTIDQVKVMLSMTKFFSF